MPAAKCSRCGADVAKVIPGKLPLCSQCDAVLRPPERQPTFDEPPEKPLKKEGFFQAVSTEIGQYKTQFFWLMVGVGLLCVMLLITMCCSCGFFLLPGTPD